MSPKNLRNLGPVYKCPENFESATFSVRIQKYFHPHVAYSNRICPSTRIRNVSGFTLVLRTLQVNRGYRTYDVKPSAAILRIDFTVRNWARSCYVIRIKKIMRIGVHTVPDSYRIKKYRLWRAYSKSSGFASEFAGYVWTEGVSGKKKLRIQKHTCGRGLRRTIRLSLRSVLLGDKRNRGVDSGAVFEWRTTTGSEPNSLLTCLHTTTFTLLNIFFPLQMISIRIWEIPLSWHAKCSVPVAVCVSKTRVLELPI